MNRDIEPITFRSFAAAFATLALAAGAAQAAVSADEAAKLKTTLTPFGAERAGNRDGSIPEWKGCPELKAPLEKLKSGDRRWDPYEAEKPVATVNAANAQQHADKLSGGVLALLKKYPTLQLNVYKTHRTHCAPEAVYENTFKNATGAKLVETGGNTGVEGALGGIAFPIPKNGLEARWNFTYRWRGTSWETKARQYSWTTGGDRVLGTQALQFDQYEHYRPNASADPSKSSGLGWMFLQMTD